MYLSKITLDPQHPQVRRDLASPYEMHRTLTRAFVTSAEQPPPRFLWRLETTSMTPHGAPLLVQGNDPADWSSLLCCACIEGNRPLSVARLIDRADGRLRFRLLANPTVTRAGKRHGLCKEPDQLAWLERQADQHGFTVTACLRVGHGRLQTWQGKTGRRITLDTTLFEGSLQVRDAAGLQRAVQSGLGHGKALGLGLLSVAPLR